MRCRAWETKHQNGKTYLHVVHEDLEVEYIKDIAERVARSLLIESSPSPIHRDVTGSYLLADKGHESLGFSAFVPLDSHILEDIQAIKEGLEGLVRGHQAQAQALLLVMRKLGLSKE